LNLKCGKKGGRKEVAVGEKGRKRIRAQNFNSKTSFFRPKIAPNREGGERTLRKKEGYRSGRKQIKEKNQFDVISDLAKKRNAWRLNGRALQPENKQKTEGRQKEKQTDLKREGTRVATTNQ